MEDLGIRCIDCGAHTNTHATVPKECKKVIDLRNVLLYSIFWFTISKVHT